jgi:hypothetical protein
MVCHRLHWLALSIGPGVKNTHLNREPMNREPPNPCTTYSRPSFGNVCLSFVRIDSNRHE